MKILITNLSNTLNYGSAMMGINLIHYLSKALPQALFTVECDTYHRDRLREATGKTNIECVSIPTEKSRNKLLNLWKYLTSRHIRLRSIVKDYDAMIVIGGDDFSGVHVSMLSMAIQFNRINSGGCKVLLVGQTMGPFKKSTLRPIGLLLRKILITTRDHPSYLYLTQKVGAKNVHEYRDLALLPLPLQSEFSHSEEVAKYTSRGKYILLVPSGLYRHYGLTKEEAIERWRQMILLLRKEYPSYNIMLLPHVLSLTNQADDRHIIEPLLSVFANDQQVYGTLDIMQPAQARAIIAASQWVVTGRMHAAVSSFATGRISLSLAYSVKYYGVIVKGLKSPELVLDCRGAAMHSPDFIVHFQKKITQIVAQQVALEEQINTIIRSNEEQSFAQFELLKKELIS